MFALFGVACFLRQRRAPGGRFPRGLALGSHLVFSISTSSPPCKHYIATTAKLLRPGYLSLFLAGENVAEAIAGITLRVPRLEEEGAFPALAGRFARLLARESLAVWELLLCDILRRLSVATASMPSPHWRHSRRGGSDAGCLQVVRECVFGAPILRSPRKSLATFQIDRKRIEMQHLQVRSPPLLAGAPSKSARIGPIRSY